MNPQRADRQMHDEGFDKISFVAALAVIGAGAAGLLSMAVLLFSEWVPLHALAAESDATSPVQIVTLRSLTAARTIHAPKTPMWTTMDASLIHFSGFPQVITNADVQTTSAQRGQLGSANASVVDTPRREVDRAVHVRSEILTGPDRLDRITSTGVESAIAKVKDELETKSPSNPEGVAEAKSKAEEAAREAQDRVKELAKLR